MISASDAFNAMMKGILSPQEALTKVNKAEKNNLIKAIKMAQERLKAMASEDGDAIAAGYELQKMSQQQRSRHPGPRPQHVQYGEQSGPIFTDLGDFSRQAQQCGRAPGAFFKNEEFAMCGDDPIPTENNGLTYPSFAQQRVNHGGKPYDWSKLPNKPADVGWEAFSHSNQGRVSYR